MENIILTPPNLTEMPKLRLLNSQDGWMEFYTQGYFLPVHSTELANIPQVKALIEALELVQTDTHIEEHGKCPVCYHDIQTVSVKNAMNKALAPFKKSAGDK